MFARCTDGAGNLFNKVVSLQVFTKVLTHVVDKMLAKVFFKVCGKVFAKVIGKVFGEGGTVGNLRW